VHCKAAVMQQLLTSLRLSPERAEAGAAAAAARAVCAAGHAAAVTLGTPQVVDKMR
jgi:hypothetical protein